MKYDIILLDADETLMDFPDAEHQALVRTFEDHHLTLTPSIDQLYQQINSGLWKQFEQQLITRKQLLSTRFAQLFDTLGITGIDSAQNIVVVKTMPGLASAACAALEHLKNEK